MNTTVIVVIIVVVVLAAIGAAVYMIGAKRRTERLQEQFGPEYNRTLAETENRKATEQELTQREKRHSELDLRPLGEQERAGFRDRWLGIQSDFVDDPDRAVNRADALVSEVMSARGYPIADFDRQADDLSVEHPVVVQRFREAREISVRNAGGEVDTEELRRAVTSYRSLIDALLDERDDTGHTGTARRGTTGERDTRGDRDVRDGRDPRDDRDATAGRGTPEPDPATERSPRGSAAGDGSGAQAGDVRMRGDRRRQSTEETTA